MTTPTEDRMLPDSPVLQEIMKLLGLPKYVSEFTLVARHGELPQVTCTYYPTNRAMAGTVTEDFTFPV